jgi:hypothetical protein
MRRALAAVPAALLVWALPAFACGVCVDDKVAAAYDHAVVTDAIARRHVVVFAEVRGPGTVEALVRKARTAAGRVRGVERASVRAAASPAALSFALDPAVATPQVALAAVGRAVPGLQLTLLRVMP